MNHRQGSCLLLLLAAILTAGVAAADPAPVLVELFTTEASASSVPADQLLAKLDSTAVVLGEHVAAAGMWRDRFVIDATTKRQQAYADHFNLDRTYTPHMVVNGVVRLSLVDARFSGHRLGFFLESAEIILSALSLRYLEPPAHDQG